MPGKNQSVLSIRRNAAHINPTQDIIVRKIIWRGFFIHYSLRDGLVSLSLLL